MLWLLCMLLYALAFMDIYFFNTVAFICASYLRVKHTLPWKFYEEMTATLHTDNKPDFVFLYGT